MISTSKITTHGLPVAPMKNRAIAKASRAESAFAVRPSNRAEHLRAAILTTLFVLASGLPSEAESPRTLTVGMFPAEPLLFMSEGKPSGLFADLLDHIAAANNWSLSYKESTWSQLLDDLAVGKIDLLPAVAITPERHRLYDFSRLPVFIDSGVIMSPKASLPRTIWDMEGERIAAVKGSIYTRGFEEYIDSFGVKCQMLYVEDNPTVMQAITERKADAGVCIYSLGNELMRHYPVALTAISFSPLALGFATSKGQNPDIIAAIDSDMKTLVSDLDSIYYASLEKWTSPYRPFSLPPWLRWSLIALLSIAFLVILMALLLKRQVAAKTESLRIEISQRMAIEEALRTALAEKSILIRELFHRTRNTMQVIIGINGLQIEKYPQNIDLAHALSSANDMISALSLVQDILYESKDLSRISVLAYVSSLVEAIKRSYSPKTRTISFILEVPDEPVLIDILAPLGLVINELVLNSIKHAFPDDRMAIISLAMTVADDGSMSLTISDNGIGIGESQIGNYLTSVGTSIVRSICKAQLSGTIAYSIANGLTASIRIPAPSYSMRV